ncbi:hypothetical protein predicted by Glimmer/Critica [Lactiplantibacillus plantarum]|nr:hypothetical protein predicted by Glimmer/Critica [Lactiplantibacillus plantarum]
MQHGLIDPSCQFDADYRLQVRDKIDCNGTDNRERSVA